MPLSKINVPLDTPVQAGQSNNNYYGEVAKIQALAANLNRTTTGQVTWTSDTSGITYNTANYSSQSTINNKGETGLLNLLIYLYGTDASSQKRFIMTADDWNEINDILVGYGDGTLAVSKASKISTQSAIGSANQPVYVASTGVITPCVAYSNASVGYATEAGKIGSTDVGSNTTPVWIDDGVPKACTAVAADTAVNATNATTASKLGTSTVGSSTKPIYLVNGVANECVDFSSATVSSAGTASALATPRDLKVDLASTQAVSFDGTDDAVTIGVSSVLPRANGGTGTDTAQGSATRPVYLGSSGIAPCTYSLNATVSAGAANKLAYYSDINAVSAAGDAGSAIQPIYLNAGVPTACTNTIAASTAAGSTGKLAYYSGANQISSYGTTVGANNRIVYFNAGVPTAGIRVSYGSTLPSSGMAAGDLFIKI